MSKRKDLTPWRNRITGYGELPASDFLANPGNWRIHPAAQGDALDASISAVGWVQNVIVNKVTGNLVDGHLRVNMALRRGDDTPIPVTFVELTEQEEAIILATIDPIGAMAATDKDKLSELVATIEGDETVNALLQQIAEREKIDFGPPPADDPGADIDRAAELLTKWGVQTGDIWQLGDHRLACGDCTVKEVVEAVMMGERADLGFADPPYNADVDKWDTGFIWSHDWLIDLCDYVIVTPGISQAAEFLKITNMPYKWTLAAYISNGYARSAVGFGWWMFAPLFSNETVFRQKPDAIEIALVSGQADGEHHRGQKPPQFMEWVLELYCKDIVLDIFGGSGTTLIAAQRTGRKARLIEISPAYCSVILERWSVMTGETPVKLEKLENYGR